MKKHTTLFILITLVACLMLNGCAGKGIANKSDKRVLNAINVLQGGLLMIINGHLGGCLCVKMILVTTNFHIQCVLSV